MIKTLYTLVSKEDPSDIYGFLDEDHGLCSFPDPEMTFDCLESTSKLCEAIKKDLEVIKEDILKNGGSCGCESISECDQAQVSYITSLIDNLRVVKLEVSFVPEDYHPL